MSALQGNENSNNGAKDQGKGGAKNEGDAQGGPLHHCHSDGSFRTATPDSTFGHPLHQAPRAMTRDPSAVLQTCPSYASIRTMTPELGFGHQLRRCAKHNEENKTEAGASGTKGEEVPASSEEGPKREEKKGDEK